MYFFAGVIVGLAVGFLVGFLVYRNNAKKLKAQEDALVDIAGKFKKEK